MDRSLLLGLSLRSKQLIDQLIDPFKPIVSFEAIGGPVSSSQPLASLEAICGPFSLLSRSLRSRQLVDRPLHFDIEIVQV